MELSSTDNIYDRDFESSETFGKYVQRMRKRKGVNLRQYEIAVELGVSRGYMSMIENDKIGSSGGPPSVAPEKLRRLAQILKVPEEEVFTKSRRVPEGFQVVPVNEKAQSPSPNFDIIEEAGFWKLDPDEQEEILESIRYKSRRRNKKQEWRGNVLPETEKP